MILDIILVLTIIVIVFYVVFILPTSSCTGDCNQGRKCNCEKQ
jgi:hypothetical protein